MPLGQRLNFQASGRIEASVQGTPFTGLKTDRGFVPVSGCDRRVFDLTDTIKLGLTAPAPRARRPDRTVLARSSRWPRHLRDRRSQPEDGARKFVGRHGAPAVQEFTFDGSAYVTSFDNYIYGGLTGAHLR